MKPEDKTTIEGLLNILCDNNYKAGYNVGVSNMKFFPKLNDEHVTVRQALLEYIQMLVDEANDEAYDECLRQQRG
jgi:hypothetical protein